MHELKICVSVQEEGGSGEAFPPCAFYHIIGTSLSPLNTLLIGPIVLTRIPGTYKNNATTKYLLGCF